MCILLVEFCSMEEGFYGFVLRMCIRSEMHIIDSIITLVAPSKFGACVTLKFRLSRCSRASSHPCPRQG
jgi:hypothetical protein